MHSKAHGESIQCFADAGTLIMGVDLAGPETLVEVDAIAAIP